MNVPKLSHAALLVSIFAAPIAAQKAAKKDGPQSPAAVPTPDGALTRHPYLQLATPHSVVVVWRTRGATRPIVRFGASPEALRNTVTAKDITVRVAKNVSAGDRALRLHSAPDHTHQYEAVVRGLKPDSRSYYAVYDGEKLLAGADSEHHLTTLPTAGSERAVRLWVVGDSGTGKPPQIAVFDAMREFTAASKHPVDCFLHVGDMAYEAGTDKQFQERFFAIYSPLLRNTVCWPSMGNHEGGTSRGATGIGPYYDCYVLPTRGEAGGVPSGKEAYYSFDIGQIHFVCLDSHDLKREPDAEMALWLRADLERTKSKWCIAYWHHPPYTLGSHNSNTEKQLVEMRKFIMPVLESGGVDVVLTGHSHIYERSMLIDGAYATPTTTDGVVLNDGDGDPKGHGAYRKSEGIHPHQGTVSIVTGHGGKGLSRKGTMPIMRRIFLENGSVIIDVKGDTLTTIMLNRAGKQRDRFQIVKRGQVKPAVVPFPWHAGGPKITALAPEFSESVDVVLEARPAAPDARIHYTLDGSEPGLSSPIYQGPLKLTQSAKLRAFSVWGGGQRISPVAKADYTKLAAGTFMRRILSSKDDVEETQKGRVRAGDPQLELAVIPGKKPKKAEKPLPDRPQTVGLRFTHVFLAKGKKIKSAYVQFRSRNKRGLGSGTLRVHVPTTGSAPPFDPKEERSVSARLRDAPAVDWTPAEWRKREPGGEPHRTPDLAALLQRIIDRPDWQSGNAISVIITGTAHRDAVAFDGNPKHAPALWVRYE